MLTTFSGVGKTTRINRIFGNDGKAVMVAVNHGLGLGPVEGIENMERTLGQIMEGGPDSNPSTRELHALYRSVQAAELLLS